MYIMTLNGGVISNSSSRSRRRRRSVRRVCENHRHTPSHHISSRLTTPSASQSSVTPVSTQYTRHTRAPISPISPHSTYRAGHKSQATNSSWAAQPGGVGDIVPPLLGPVGVQGGTIKMISLAINLCFCTGRPPSLKPMAHISPSLHTPSFPLLQERIGTGSSNLVARLVTRAAMHCN